MPFAHPPSFIFSIHYSLTRISSQVVMATRLSRSCPFIGSPLAPPPLRVLVSPHIFRPLHLVRCALYNMFHGHQLPPRQQRPSKSNHESPSAQYVTRSTTFRSLRVFAASHLVSQAIKFNDIHFPSWLLTGAILAVFTRAFLHPSLIFCTSPLYNETRTLLVSFGFTCGVMGAPLDYHGP